MQKLLQAVTSCFHKLVISLYGGLPSVDIVVLAVLIKF